MNSDSSKGQFELPLPKVIRIEPASHCNFRCRHCTTGLRMNKSLGIMKKEDFDTIFERIKHLDFRVSVMYHGGEPLLNPNLFYMIDKMKTISKMTKFVCNGSLLNPSKIDKILASKLDLIEFSLDGTSANENNSIRVGSDFEKISGRIKELLVKRKEMGSKLKVWLSNVQMTTPETDTSTIEIPDFLKEAFKDHLDEITIRCFWALYWPGYPRKTPITDKPVKNSCDLIENTITVRWNGDIVACCYDLTSKMVLGNLIKEPIEDIWNNAKYLYLRKAVNDYNPPAMCKGCNFLYKEKHMTRDELQAI